jgi:hypothetical protein
MKNNKDLLQFIFRQMEKLDEKKISPEIAKEQANLAKQANNSLRYEIEKAALLFKLEQSKSQVEINEIELAS